MPSWKKPPQIRLSLGNLSLTDEVLADRGGDQIEEPNPMRKVSPKPGSPKGPGEILKDIKGCKD